MCPSFFYTAYLPAVIAGKATGNPDFDFGMDKFNMLEADKSRTAKAKEANDVPVVHGKHAQAPGENILYNTWEEYVFYQQLNLDIDIFS